MAGQIVTAAIIVLLLLLVLASLVGAILANLSRSYPDPENSAVLEREREALIVADAISGAIVNSRNKVIPLRRDPEPPKAA